METGVQSLAMTVREAATFLNAKRSHVYTLIHAGVLPYQVMGDHFLVPRKDVVALLDRSWTKNGK